jgi:hypothetical protein
MTKEIWKLSRSEQLIALVALALSFIARGLALLPGYAIDDYGTLIADPTPLYLSQGRIGAAVLREILRRLDAVPPTSGQLGNIALTVTLVWVGILICRIWSVEHMPMLSGLVVLFLCLHPYQAEIFTFRVAGLTLAVALALAFYGLSTCALSRRTLIVAVLAIAAALVTYQVVVNYLAMVLLFNIVFYFARGRDDDQNEAGRVLRDQLVTFTLALLCFALATLAIPFVLRLPLTQRTAMMTLSQAPVREALLWKQLGVMFIHSEAILPVATKYLLILTPIATLAISAIQNPRTLQTIRLRSVLAFLLAVLLGVPGSLGVVLILQEWWPVPRVCEHIGIFWAGIFVLVYRIVPTLSRRVMLLLSGVILFSFLGSNNHIFLDQNRVNRRDQANANRMVARLEALPGFSPTEAVAIIGGFWGYPSPIPTAEGDMNISALYAEWSKLYVLNEVSGYNLKPAPPDAVEKAKAYCVAAQKWPAPESVAKLDSVSVVCQ